MTSYFRVARGNQLSNWEKNSGNILEITDTPTGQDTLFRGAWGKKKTLGS